MTQPQRITRSRQQKQTSPNGLPIKYVGRPSVWGNPFKHINGCIYVNAAYRRTKLGPWVYVGQGDLEDCLMIYEFLLTRKIEFLPQIESFISIIDHTKRLSNLKFWQLHFEKLNLQDLSGQNLSCWCKPGAPCHVDVLLNHVKNYKPKSQRDETIIL